MSRASFSNDKYTFAFGVDHTPMGCFFQIWERAAEGEIPLLDETGSPQVEADELFHLDVKNDKTLERNPALTRALEPLRQTSRYLRNEETIIGIGKALGLDVAEEVRCWQNSKAGPSSTSNSLAPTAASGWRSMSPTLSMRRVSAANAAR